jgi:tetratricopeptide (TPR) repeat protein
MPARRRAGGSVVPATLRDALEARLDRLGAAREIAQIGAAIGRSFDYDLLARVCDRSTDGLAVAIDRLVRSELVIARGDPPDAVYSFKHALVQDVAYGTLLRSRRRELHARIARLLQERSTQTGDADPELLAHHFTEAGLLDQALLYWQVAGERATKRSANLEAIAQFRRGLDALGKLADRPAHAAQELKLLIGLGAALMMTRTSASPEIAETYARARLLAHETGRAAELSPALWGSWGAAFSRGDMAAARALADALLDLGRGQDDSGIMMQAHHAAWTTLLTAGDFEGTCLHVEAGIALYQSEAHRHHAHVYGGHDPKVCGYALSSLAQVMLGFPSKALEQKERAFATARDVGHPLTVAHALWLAAELHQLRREPKDVEDLTAALLPLVSEHGSAVGVANAKMLQGWALAAQGKGSAGLADLQAAMASWRATGSKFHVPYRLARAADAYRMAGQVNTGLGLIDEAIEVSANSDDRWFESALYDLRSDLLVAIGNLGEAENGYLRALEIARRQGARMLELRTATHLARLWQSKGKRIEARNLLAPVYGWFTDGFDTADLKDAKALLDELT